MPARWQMIWACWAIVLMSGVVAGADDTAAHPAGLPSRAPGVSEVRPGAVPLPINLPTALRLANVRPVDVLAASERIRLSSAQWQRARVLWLPTFLSGTDYYRHDGQIQDIQGNVFNANKGSFLLGTGPYAVFATSDALFLPLAQRQVVRSQEAAYRVAINDTMFAVAEAYFNVQEARGELAGAAEAVAQTEELLRRTQQLGEVLTPAFEQVRTAAELSRRRQWVHRARERWGLASAELNRSLRLDPMTVLEPVEPPQFQVVLIDPQVPLDDLIRTGLTRRPELAASQGLVQATLYRLRQERMRPLMPSILLRGAAPGVTGTMSAGLFGGGLNGNMGGWGPRQDYDLQVLWELQNMGFGNRALVREKQSDHRLAVLEVMRVQDRVAAEVVQAHLQLDTSTARLRDAEDELQSAQRSLVENFIGLKQTRPSGELPTLIARPQEVVAAVQALAQAYSDYYSAVADYNRAQFRLYRAVGNPGAALAGQVAGTPPPAPAPPAAPRGQELVPPPRPDNSKAILPGRAQPVSSRRTARSIPSGKVLPPMQR
jgi:outer membrane protein TolC